MNAWAHFLIMVLYNAAFKKEQPFPEKSANQAHLARRTRLYRTAPMH